MMCFLLPEIHNYVSFIMLAIKLIKWRHCMAQWNVSIGLDRHKHIYPINFVVQLFKGARIQTIHIEVNPTFKFRYYLLWISLMFHSLIVRCIALYHFYWKSCSRKRIHFHGILMGAVNSIFIINIELQKAHS